MSTEETQRLEEIVSRFERIAQRMDRQVGQELSDLEETYRQTLQEAVAVLEQTKGSFRSKQLKQLRERIESVLAR